MSKQPSQIVGIVVGLRACGHEDWFKILGGEPPAFASVRRVKWNGKRCPACIQREQDAQRAEAAARRAADLQKFRLPEGSVFALAYHAAGPTRGTWRGSLTVPGREGSMFAESSSVHVLVKRLGHQWFAEQKERPAPAPPPEAR